MTRELLHYHWHNCVNRQQPDLSEKEQKRRTKLLYKALAKSATMIATNRKSYSQGERHAVFIRARTHCRSG